MPRKKTKEKLGNDPLKWVKDSRKGQKQPSTKVSEPEVIETVQDKPEKPLSEKGLPDGWTRWAVIVRKEYLDKVKAYAYWERMEIKQVLDEALEAYFKGKKIKHLPEGK